MSKVILVVGLLIAALATIWAAIVWLRRMNSSRIPKP